DLGGDLGIELVSGEDRPVVVEGSDAAHLARRVVSRDETAVLERVEDRFSLGLGQCDAGTQARPEDALDAPANPVEADVVEAAAAGLLAEIPLQLRAPSRRDEPPRVRIERHHLRVLARVAREALDAAANY